MTSPPPPSLPVLRQLLNEATSTRRPGGDELWQDLLAAREEARYQLTKSLPALLDLVERQAAAIEAVQKLTELWRYKGEFGWGPWQTGEGPDFEGQVLDDAAAHIRDALAPHLSGITPTTEETTTDEH